MDTTATPADPPRRLEVPPAAGRGRRRWLPTGAVALVIMVVVLGGYVTAAALSEPTGPPVTVGGVVRVQPLSGWETAEASPVGELAFARLTRGGGNLDIVVLPSHDGDAGSLAHEYVTEALEPQLSRLSVSDELEPATLAGEPTGSRFDYVGITDTGASVEGQVTALVLSSGDGVVFDGWAPQGLLVFVEGDLRTMLERAVFA